MNTRSAMVQKVINLLPLAMSYLTADSEGKEKPSQAAMLLRSFFETLDEKQFEQLSKVLSEEQMMTVFKIIENLQGSAGSASREPREANELHP